MRVTKISPFSGKENTLDIPVTPEQLTAWQNGAMIQTAMPHLSADHREFLLNGITAEEWDDTFSEEPK